MVTHIIRHPCIFAGRQVDTSDDQVYAEENLSATCRPERRRLVLCTEATWKCI